MGGWPDGLKKFQGAYRRENFFRPFLWVWGHAPQKILKTEYPRLAKNAFLAIERSKISAVC